MRWTVSIIILALSLHLGDHAALAAQKKESAPSADFWTSDRVHTIHIRISAQQWNMTQPLPNRQGRQHIIASSMPRPSAQPSNEPVLTVQPPSTQPVVHREGDRLAPNFYGYEFAYVKAGLECDGVKLKDVGFRQRGNSSFGWGSSGYRRPYKVNFGEFVDGQKFAGMTGFYLNNNAYDPSLLRETLAYEVFRSLGMPAPRTTFALVYLTIEGRVEGEYLGLYTLLEKIDTGAFLKRQFGSGKGMLMKPWSIRGFPYMGEKWSAYESHYNARETVTEAGARRTIDFIKLVNYADDQTFRAQIEQYLNVEEFLGVLAVNVTIANMDNILFTGHNFFFYLNPKDNRLYMMPWDMNLSFANYTSAGSADQQVNLSIMHPHAGEAKVIDRLLAIPQYNQVYRQHITRLMQTTCNTEKLSARVDALQSVLVKADQAADEVWKARFIKGNAAAATRPSLIPQRPVPQLMGWSGQPAIAIKTFMARRTESLRAQLAGEADGYSPAPHVPPTAPPGGARAHAVYGNVSQTAVALVRAADDNYDRTLSGSEFAGVLRESLAQADTGKRGELDKSQIEGIITRFLQTASARRAERGARGGQRSPAAPLADTSRPWAQAILNVVDTEKAGRVGIPRLVAAAGKAFSEADRDKNGRLDESEVWAMLDALAAASPPAPLGPVVAPAVVKPSVTKPPASQPIASKTAAPQAVAVKPAAAQRASTRPAGK